MAAPNKLNDQQKIDIVEAYLKGKRSVELAKLYNVSPQAILGLLKRRGIVAKGYKDATSHHTLDYNFFENIDTEEKAYFLGLLFADGNTSLYIPPNRKSPCYRLVLELQEDDNFLVYKLKEVLNSTSIIKRHHKKSGYGKNNGRPSVRLTIYNKQIVTSLINKGCIPAKSKVLEMPKGVPDNLIRHFVRGYTDGDGSFYLPKTIDKLTILNKTCWNITSSTSFCKQLQMYLHKTLNLKTYLVSNKNNREYTSDLRLLGSRKSLTILLDWMYRDATIYMQRKYDKVQQFYQYQDYFVNQEGA